jgi:hypothetical protein
MSITSTLPMPDIRYLLLLGRALLHNKSLETADEAILLSSKAESVIRAGALRRRISERLQQPRRLPCRPGADRCRAECIRPFVPRSQEVSHALPPITSSRRSAISRATGKLSMWELITWSWASLQERTLLQNGEQQTSAMRTTACRSHLLWFSAMRR